jgi:hypothetical protein
MLKNDDEELKSRRPNDWRDLQLVWTEVYIREH